MKKKIFKIILFIILIIIAIFLVKFTYNFCYYQKLIKARDNVIKSGNYTCNYYSAGQKLDVDTGTWATSYSKMGVKVKGEKSVSYNYSGENENYDIVSKSYYDNSSNKEVIYLNLKENSFQVQPNFLPLYIHSNLINYPIYNFNEYYMENTSLKDKLFYIVTSYIPQVFLINFKNVEEDGTKYIVIEYKDIGSKIYFYEDTLLAAKTMSKNSNENEYTANSYWEIEVGNVTDEDVNIPDLSNFRQNI